MAFNKSYQVKSGAEAAFRARSRLEFYNLPTEYCLGVAELDEATHLWRVSVLLPSGVGLVGGIVVDAKTGFIVSERSSSRSQLMKTLLKASQHEGGDTFDVLSDTLALYHYPDEEQDAA